jgi:ubiquinone/menaquinone biosynthesis C-methylase UbiE
LKEIITEKKCYVLIIYLFILKVDVMDVRDLQYDDEHFDVIIDKSTMDALLCGDQSFLNVAIMTKEVQRVLKTGGVYIVISYGQPENRIAHLVS